MKDEIREVLEKTYDRGYCKAVPETDQALSQILEIFKKNVPKRRKAGKTCATCDNDYDRCRSQCKYNQTIDAMLKKVEG